jgi:predicted small integral membrane protein
MDTTFPNNKGMWRAITSPFIHHVFYLGIIAWETVTAGLCWVGTAQCLRAIKGSGRAFNRAKHIAIGGLTLSLLMWMVAFIVVGAEWFLMWQSKEWNGQGAAFRMFAILGIILIFLSLPDGDLDTH